MNCTAATRFPAQPTPPALILRWIDLDGLQFDDARIESARRDCAPGEFDALIGRRSGRAYDRGICRAALRRLIAEELGGAPSRVPLQTLDDGALRSIPGLACSVSHTGGIGLVAVARVARLGVDVECILANRDTWGAAQLAFDPHGRARLAATHPDRRAAAFVQAWSVREAAMKALGGLELTAMSRLRVVPTAAGTLAVHDGAGRRAWARTLRAPQPGRWRAALAWC